MAGFHTLLDTVANHAPSAPTSPCCNPGLHKIIGFARRTQGLMVPPGNPLRLHTLHDLIERGARFANRSLGSGTRVVLDELLDLQWAARRADQRLRTHRALARGRGTSGGLAANGMPGWALPPQRSRPGWTLCRWRRALPPGLPEVGPEPAWRGTVAATAANTPVARRAVPDCRLRRHQQWTGVVDAPGLAMVEFQTQKNKHRGSILNYDRGPAATRQTFSSLGQNYSHRLTPALMPLKFALYP